MKKCSRCRKKSPYALKALGLNWAGLKAREDYKTKDNSDYSRQSKLIHLRLCPDCVLSCDLILEGCGHCDMKCSLNCHCPTWMDNMDKKFEMEVNNAKRKT